MKNKFLVGMISGLLLSILTIGITFLVLKTIYPITVDNSVNGIYQNVNKGDGSQQGNSSGSGSGHSSSQLPNIQSNAVQEKNLFTAKTDLMMAYIDKYYIDEVDKSAIYDAMLHALADAVGDPYTSYYSVKEYEDMTLQSTGNYCGIGATVTQNKEDLKMYIVYPYEGSPAKEVGLQPMDEIVAVDGVDVVGGDLDDVVSHMRGEPGTDVVISVLRGEERLDFTLTRREIELTYVDHEMLEDKIGYIFVSSFANITTTQFKNALEDLKGQGMKSLIIDLRGNGGGVLDAATDMLDMLVEKDKTLVYTEDKAGNREYTYAKTKESIDIPVAVLVNEYSASASEVFSGCLQAHDKAKIIGTQTYGKGVVQAVIPLNVDSSGFKITAWRYFTPADECIHGIGITPDIVVEMIEPEEGEDDIDEQLEAAKEYLTSERE